MPSYLTDLLAYPFFRLAVLMIALLLVAEQLFPARPAPSLTKRTLNIKFTLLTLSIMLVSLWVQTSISQSIISLIGKTGVIDLRMSFDSAALTAAAAILLSTVTIDFFYYWMHRLQHTSPALWQEHLLHHSDEDLSVLTPQRVHVLENVIAPVFVTVPMTILFDLPPVTIAWLSLTPTAWTYVLHSNLRIGFGPLWWLFSSPQYHRLHHSILPEHRDRNFAVYFPLWDIIFGTAMKPRPNEYAPTGVEGVHLRTLHAALAYPFLAWLKMARSALRYPLRPRRP